MSEEQDKINENNEKESYNGIKTEKGDKEIQSEIETKYEENSENIEIKGKTEIKPKLKIDLERQRYPYCIVWTPIPCVTWLFPSIGHAGICTSEGVIYDFAGPYYVSVDNMAFGNPTKYIFLDLDPKECERYDDAIEEGKDDYTQQMYSFCCNNCHSFIARCLNKLRYKGKTNYTMVHIWWMLCIKSKFISLSKFIQSYLGFVIIIILILVIYFFSTN